MSKFRLFLHPFRTTALYCLLVLSTIICIGCSSQGKQSSVAPTEAAPTSQKTQAPAVAPTETAPTSQKTKSPAITINQQKIKFRLNGVKAFALKPEADGMKLVDGNKKDLAWFEVDDRQNITIKNTSDQVIGYVISGNGNWQVKSVGNTKKTYILQQQGNGNYKLEDGANQEIYAIKARNDGLEIETPNQRLLYQVQVKNDKVSLKNRSTQTVLSTKSKLTPIAVACFGFEVLSREQQAALAYALKISGEE